MVADRDVLHMSWRVAARACAAVFELAESGVGQVESTEQAGVLRLRVPGAVALFRPERATRTFFVLRVYVTR